MSKQKSGASALTDAVDEFFGKTVFPFTLTLAEPLEGSGAGSVASITLRKPKGRDWVRWQGEKDLVTRNTGLLRDLSGLDAEVFGDLDAEDHAVLMRIADGFFARYRPEESGLMTFMSGLGSSSAGDLSTTKNSISTK